MEKSFELAAERSAQHFDNAEPGLFLQAFDSKAAAPQKDSTNKKDFSNEKDSSAPKDPGNTDREYGVPSPARQLFNEAFDDFRLLTQSVSPEDALSSAGVKMNQSIEEADDYTERSQTVFYGQLDPKHIQDSKPTAELIEKLQLMSAALTQVMPGQREDLMRDLSKGNTAKLSQYEDVKKAYEKVSPDFAGTSKTALIKAWLDYRAGIGDSIGQRAVFIGLQRRFGSNETADLHEAKITEFKNRIGGRFVFD